MLHATPPSSSCSGASRWGTRSRRECSTPSTARTAPQRLVRCKEYAYGSDAALLASPCPQVHDSGVRSSLELGIGSRAAGWGTNNAARGTIILYIESPPKQFYDRLYTLTAIPMCGRAPSTCTQRSCHVCTQPDATHHATHTTPLTASGRRGAGEAGPRPPRGYSPG